MGKGKTMHKHLKWFQEYKSIGYRLRLGRSGHYKIYDPAGKLVTTIPSTPSDRRSEVNARSQLRRHQRQIGEHDA